MSLFLWANFGYFGGLLCMFAYLLRSRQYFFMKFWADIFANSASHNTEKYYGMLLCSRNLFLFFWASLGNGSLYLVKSQYFLMLFCTESLFITLAITNQEKISCWITLCLGHFGKVLGLFRSIKY